jgi:hypothetical protein
MGQLLVMIIVPPVVGVVTYAVLRLLWKRDKEADRAAKRNQVGMN